MYLVKEHIAQLLGSLPQGVRLVAVSKYHPAEYIEEAYAVGQRIFGESHVQELRQKVEVLPSDIEWHFIGHLQTNKVKYIAPYISMIESVDSERLMAEINKQCTKHDRVVDVLLELHVAKEETKSGFAPEELDALLASGVKEKYPNVRICGIMTMASFTDDESLIESEFEQASQFFDKIKTKYFEADDYFTVKSWGMSGDYPLAIKHHSNMIRVGTLLFGPRVY